jgi:hypothetical protein
MEKCLEQFERKEDACLSQDGFDGRTCRFKGQVLPNAGHQACASWAL